MAVASFALLMCLSFTQAINIKERTEAKSILGQSASSQKYVDDPMLMQASEPVQKPRSLRDVSMQLAQVNSISEAFEDSGEGLSPGMIAMIIVLCILCCYATIYITVICVAGNIFKTALKEAEEKEKAA